MEESMVATPHHLVLLGEGFSSLVGLEAYVLPIDMPPLSLEVHLSGDPSSYLLTRESTGEQIISYVTVLRDELKGARLKMMAQGESWIELLKLRKEA